MQFNDGFISFRKDKSMFYPGQLTYYYQAQFYMKQLKKWVYIIIPQDQQQTILIHDDLVKLMKVAWREQIRCQKDKAQFRGIHYKIKLQNFMNPITIHQIKEQILALKDQNYDAYNQTAISKPAASPQLPLDNIYDIYRRFFED